MKKQTLSEELWKGLGDAVADIRQKVVEEGYFGRAVTQLDIDAPQWPVPRDPEAREHEAEQQPEHDHGIDL
jgi:hypothetical protein